MANHNNDDTRFPLVRYVFDSAIPNSVIPIFQLGIIIVFLAVSSAVLFGWADGDFTLLSRPLFLLMGLCIIVFVLTLVRTTTAGILSILIVGALVVPESYLIRIAHMIINPSMSIEEYARTYEADAIPPVDPKELVDRVLAELEGENLQPQVQDRVREIVSETTLDAILSRVRAEGATTPLRWVLEGREEIRRNAAEYEGFELFEDDMNFLRREGLIAFSGEDYGRATPTELGRRVAPLIDGARKVSSFDLGRPLPTEMDTLVLDEQTDRTFPSGGDVDWLVIDLENEGTFRIAVKSSDGDPELRLYGPDTFELVGEDDDGGGGFNSLLVSELEEGQYYIGVRNLQRRNVAYELIVSRE